MKSFRPVAFTGFSLIEILVATFLVGGIALAITGLAMFGTRLGGEGERQTVAQALGNEEVEVVRTYPYDQVAFTDDTPPGRLQRVKSVTRNQLPYTVKAHIKLVDDPANGTIPPPITPLTADYKQVLFEVTWPGWPGSQGSTSSNVVAAAILTPQAGTCTPGAATCPNPTLDCTPGAPAACPDGSNCPATGICPDSTTPPFITCPESGICPPASGSPVPPSPSPSPAACTTNADCSAGQSCVSGQCQSTASSSPPPPSPSPVACTSNIQCSAGQLCLSGQCQPAICADPENVEDQTSEVCSKPTDAVCNDGIDNDGDGISDENDPGCTTQIVALSGCINCSSQLFGEIGRIPSVPCVTGAAFCGLTRTWSAACGNECNDGIDNDGDGLKDQLDSQCEAGSDSEGSIAYCDPNACEQKYGCPNNSSCAGCPQGIGGQPVCSSGLCFQCSASDVSNCNDTIPQWCPGTTTCPASGVCADGSKCGNYCDNPSTFFIVEECICRNGECAQCQEWENEPDGTNELCPNDQFCQGGNCVQCRIDTDCAAVAGKPACLNNACVACTTNAHCPAGNICTQNACEALPVVHQCNDGFDNDGDGLVDLADPQCAIIGSTSEF